MFCDQKTFMRPTAMLFDGCDVFVTHGAIFVNRDATVYSHFPDSNPRHDYAHYNNESLDSTNVDQMVCGYKCRLRRLNHCVPLRSRLSKLIAKIVDDIVVFRIWKRQIFLCICFGSCSHRSCRFLFNRQKLETELFGSQNQDTTKIICRNLVASSPLWP